MDSGWAAEKPPANGPEQDDRNRCTQVMRRNGCGSGLMAGSWHIQEHLKI